MITKSKLKRSTLSIVLLVSLAGCASQPQLVAVPLAEKPWPQAPSSLMEPPPKQSFLEQLQSAFPQ